MEEKEVKLSVNALKISFRTDGGKVQAVRNVSFDLHKGETLAIVGESGSGKSVTNRAIMGILAGNAIKEGGEIIYDGQDLMKISEEDFHKIRGDKIAMIFQDPMSSLNPIMRVGKQLTEAMLIKGKINQRESRREFNRTLGEVNRCMDEARGAKDDSLIKEENRHKCNDFDKFEYKHLELENAYNRAKEAANDALAEIDDVLFRIEKVAYKDLRRDINEILRYASRSFEKYVVCERADELGALLSEIKKIVKVPFVKRAADLLRRLFNRAEAKDAEADFAAAGKVGRRPPRRNLPRRPQAAPTGQNGRGKRARPMSSRRCGPQDNQSSHHSNLQSAPEQMHPAPALLIHSVDMNDTLFLFFPLRSLESKPVIFLKSTIFLVILSYFPPLTS